MGLRVLGMRHLGFRGCWVKGVGDGGTQICNFVFRIYLDPQSM